MVSWTNVKKCSRFAAEWVKYKSIKNIKSKVSKVKPLSCRRRRRQHCWRRTMQSFHCSTFWRCCCSRSCCCRHSCSCCCCCSRSCCCRHSCSSCCYCSCCCCCCCCCCCFLRNEIFKNFCLRGFPKIAPKSFLTKFFLQQQKSNFYATNVKNVTDGCTSWVILRRFTLCFKCNRLFLKSVDRKYPNIFPFIQKSKACKGF